MAQHPDFGEPGDLEDLPLLAGADDASWSFTAEDGAVRKIEVRNPRLRSGNAGVRLAAAIEGIGVARITATFCEAALARGELVRVAARWQCEPLKIYALLPGRKLVPAKVRVFLDALEDERARRGTGR
jgi:DNA-binding transcriptional LysR family regulator